MAAVSIKALSFWYPGEDTAALRTISLEIAAGEMVLLAGITGSGKTTLLRSLKPEVAPAGRREGGIRVDAETDEIRPSQVGYVAQHPDNQLVMDSVWHELAFGLENEGLPAPVIRRRLAETAAFFGMEDWLEKKVYDLSGGQKQLLNLAAVMVMQPSVLIMDEPTAQLDPIAAREFWQMTTRIRDELGVTVILSEHQLEDVLSLCDRMLVIGDGALTDDGSPRDVALALLERNDPLAGALPAATRLAYRLGERTHLPLTIREGQQWLAERPAKVRKCAAAEPAPRRQESVLQARELWFRYDRQEDFVIRGLSLRIYPGEIHALFGGNGSGKSTLLHLLGGIDRPGRGKVVRGQGLRIGLLPQNPQTLFVADTLWEDLRDGQTEAGFIDADIRHWLERMGMGRLTGRHPYDLSGGEQQKAAFIKVMLRRPDILLLDEPTKGMDAAARQQLSRIFMELKAQGTAVLLSTHDLPFAAAVADACSLLQSGEVACTERGKAFFTGNLFYTPPLCRLTRGWADGCVTWGDLP